jgi:hypothetical protein
MPPTIDFKPCPRVLTGWLGVDPEGWVSLTQGQLIFTH